jgi:hypothetical protein
MFPRVYMHAYNDMYIRDSLRGSMYRNAHTTSALHDLYCRKQRALFVWVDLHPDNDVYVWGALWRRLYCYAYPGYADVLYRGE